MDTGDVRAKFESFGWDAVEIGGHDMAAIVEALERSRTLDRPAAIVCQTKKGKGVSAMEGRFGFHGKAAVSPEFAAEAHVLRPVRALVLEWLRGHVEKQRDRGEHLGDLVVRRQTHPLADLVDGEHGPHHRAED